MREKTDVSKFALLRLNQELRVERDKYKNELQMLLDRFTERAALIPDLQTQVNSLSKKVDAIRSALMGLPVWGCRSCDSVACKHWEPITQWLATTYDKPKGDK